MTVNIRWLDSEQSILLHQYIGGYTITDYFSALTHTNKLLCDTEKRIDIISDLTEGTLLDTGILKAITDTGSYLLPQHHLFVLVGANAFIERTIHIAMKILPGIDRRLRIATSLAEALYIIHAARSHNADDSVAAW